MGKSSIPKGHINDYKKAQKTISMTSNIIPIRQKETTTSVPLCLSSIPFWNVPKYSPVSKNKSHKFTNVPIIPLFTNVLINNSIF